MDAHKEDNNRVKWIILALILITVSPVKAQISLPLGYKTIDGIPYAICADRGVRGDLDMSDFLFDQLATSVQFEVNRYDLNSNSSFCISYYNQLLPYLKEHNLQLASLFIRGAASPDGSYERNVVLANNRTQTLIDMLQANDTLRLPIHFKSTAEDYVRLLDLLKANDDPAYNEVKSIYDSFGHNIKALKAKLMAKAPLWNRMLRQYFPQLRQARVVLLYKHRDQILADMGLPIEVLQPHIDAPQRINSYLHKDQSTDDAPPVVRPVVLDTTYRREFMSIKTNLLFDFAYVPGYDRFCPIPNVALEFYPKRGHFTYGLSFDCPWWQHYDDHKYFQIRNYQIHTRYYLRSGSIKRRQPGQGAAFKGLYLSAYLHAGIYSICFDANRGWEGEGYGGGLGLGYVIGLGKRQHWRLEIGIQGGIFRTQYDPYQWLCPIMPETDPERYYYKWYGKAEDFKRRQYRYTWLGPTRAEITISYDLLYRRSPKHGVSFRSKQKGGKR